MKNILIINYEFPPLGGGASPVTYEIAKGLVESGCHVDVITMGFKGLPSFEIMNGINVYRVKNFRKKKEICQTYEMASYVISAIIFSRKLLKNRDYDICHCHFIIPSGIIARWIKKRYGVEYVITAHGSDVPGYNPDRFKFQHKFTKPLLRTICTNAKLITAPSNYLADLIKKSIGDYPINVIPNGSKDFSLDGMKKEKILMSSGRFFTRKGFHHLINSFNEIDPDDWKLYIVGDGQLRPKLKKLANDNKNIIFTGWLDNSQEEYRKLLNKAEIFILLSSKESQGIVFIEAMSCGCSILSSNISGCIETVSEDVGLRVSIDNPDEITEKLRLLIKNKNMRSRFGKNSLKRYYSNYRYNLIIDEYKKAFL